MTSDAPPRGTYVHDLRHRYSMELRPDVTLDARMRVIATELEAAHLLAAGASTAPRFHPHLTLSRSATVTDKLVEQVATTAVRFDDGAVTFDRAGTFGDGRIIFLEPADDSIARATRAAIVAHLAATDIDPLVFTRDWTPHVTVAYAVPEPARVDALAHVRACLPLTGRFATIEAWDLDVRPTRLIQRADIGPS